MDRELKKIHDASMKVLARTGMKFYHPKALAILKKNGIKVQGQIAYFTEAQVMEWVNKAPSSFTMHARNPKYNMTMGGDNVNNAPGYGATAIVDIDGNERSALFSDFMKFAKLVHQSEHFNANGGVLCQPSDIPLKQSLAMMLYATLNLSDKCLSTGVGFAVEIEELMEMLAIVFGGKEALAKKPRTITIVNTSSPLQLNRAMTETMLTYIKYGQPITITPAVMAGTTGPITLAGTIVLSNAETLAVIALAQMMKPGTPVMYGSISCAADLRNANMATGSPEGALCYEYCARLAKAYGLPSRGGGALTEARAVSVQSGYEAMFTYLVCYKSKMNYIIHSAGVLDSYALMSYEQFIIDNEIIGMVKKYASNIDITEDKLALNVIKEVGPGGEFLTSMHTLKYCRQEPFYPDVSIRGSVSGNPNDALLANINKKKEAMLAAYEQPELPTDVKKELDNYLIGKGYNPAVLRTVN